MAAKKRKRNLIHRRLVMMEALLFVGALEMAAEDRILASTLPVEAKVGVSMLLVVGFFGSLLLVVERIARTSVGVTHQTIQWLPVPTPRLLVHVLVLTALFLAYAHVLDSWPSWLPRAL